MGLVFKPLRFFVLNVLPRGVTGGGRGERVVVVVGVGAVAVNISFFETALTSACVGKLLPKEGGYHAAEPCAFIPWTGPAMPLRLNASLKVKTLWHLPFY